MTPRRLALAKAMGYTAQIVPNGGGFAWQLHLYGEPIGDLWQWEWGAWAVVPDIEQDVAAAIEALNATGEWWTLRRVPTKDKSPLYACNVEWALGKRGEATSPSLAIFEALYAYYKVEVEP